MKAIPRKYTRVPTKGHVIFLFIFRQAPATIFIDKDASGTGHWKKQDMALQIRRRALGYWSKNVNYHLWRN